MTDAPRQDCDSSGCDLYNMPGSMYCHKHWVKNNVDMFGYDLMIGLLLGVGLAGNLPFPIGITFFAVGVVGLGSAVVFRWRSYANFEEALQYTYRHKWGLEEDQIP